MNNNSSSGYTSGYEPTVSREVAARLKKYAEEDKAALDAKMAPYVAQANQTLREIAKAQKSIAHQFWSRDIATIKNQLRHELAIDAGVALADAETYDAAATSAAMEEFLDTLPVRTGWTLSLDGGTQRLAHYVLVQSVLGHKDCSTVAAIQVCMDRLCEVDAFADGECGFDKSTIRKPAPKIETPKQKTLADLEAIDTSTREGVAESRRLAEELALSERAHPLQAQFIEHIRSYFGHEWTPADGEAFKVYHKRNGGSLADHRVYDNFRKYATRIGHWDKERFLTEEEKISDLIESSDMSNYDAKREVMRREAAARQTQR